jgi:hypothetical protein
VLRTEIIRKIFVQYLQFLFSLLVITLLHLFHMLHPVALIIRYRTVYDALSYTFCSPTGWHVV